MPSMYSIGTTEDRVRFLAKVNRRGPNECWPWVAATNPKGYGVFRLSHGKNALAHRLAYLWFVGPIPEGFLVAHTCDTPFCVNWEKHLVPVLPKRNSQDMVERGRACKGSARPQSKINEKIAAALKGEFVPGRFGEVSRLAEKYKVSVQTVSNVTRGVLWQHVQVELGSAQTGEGPYVRKNSGENNGQAKVTVDVVRRIRLEFKKGSTCKELGAKYRLSRQAVTDIVFGRTWKTVK